jgi:predicted phage tail protein
VNTPGAVDLLRWEALKGFVDGSFEFGGVTVLATTMKSSDTLNSNTSRLINVIATRKLPTWNGSEWSMPQSSRSIAWAAADVLLNPAYGAGLSDDDIDLDGLLELDAVWSSRGDQFNGVFDQATTVWDALSQILRAGRARAYQQGGKIRFHRDQAQTTPIGMFSLANINLNSFRLEFAFPIPGEAAGGVEGEFFNERTWRPDSVTAGDPEFAHEQLFGITNNTQAQLETDYQERTNRLRRVFCTFETELEGLIPSQGDLILISHDLPQWGFSGDVLSYDASFRIATLSVDVDLDDAFTWTIQFRDARGRPSQQVLIDPLPDANQVQLQTDPTYYDSSDFDVFVGPAQEPTHFIIGRTSREAREAIVTNIVPRTEAVEIQCVLENDDVHVES